MLTAFFHFNAAKRQKNKPKQKLVLVKNHRLNLLLWVALDFEGFLICRARCCNWFSLMVSVHRAPFRPTPQWFHSSQLHLYGDAVKKLENRNKKDQIIPPMVKKNLLVCFWFCFLGFFLRISLRQSRWVHWKKKYPTLPVVLNSKADHSINIFTISSRASTLAFKEWFLNMNS